MYYFIVFEIHTIIMFIYIIILKLEDHRLSHTDNLLKTLIF